MTVFAFTRRTLCSSLGGAALALVVGSAAAQQVLQIGRVEFPSPLSDIAEGVVKEAFKRSGLQPEFKRLPLSRSVAMAMAALIIGNRDKG